MVPAPYPCPGMLPVVGAASTLASDQGLRPDRVLGVELP
jgi:hypothetical protein